ncbi:unnamed protein product, partial [Rotaria socialis]
MPESVIRKRLTGIAKNVSTCSAKATVYAACVINHSDLKKDSCLKEFLALKDCVQKA